jgi:hypothetical protein
MTLLIAQPDSASKPLNRQQAPDSRPIPAGKIHGIIVIFGSLRVRIWLPFG